MTANASAIDALQQFRLALNRATSNAFRLLLETKHLYQHIAVDAVSMMEKLEGTLGDGERIRFAVGAQALVRQTITLVDAPTEQYERRGHTNMLLLEIANIKTFCARCDSAEVAAPVWYRDIAGLVDRATLPHTGGAEIGQSSTSHQTFVLAFQCQRCKGEHDVYTVRRVKALQFSLDGRSPMEHLALPTFIPKQERNLFRDALIASHGGKTLAALFYLRTFVEQFARRQTGVTGRATGDELMSSCPLTLPASQRDAMPSLKEQYDLLSDAIHAAREDADLFERCRRAIEKHFDIRRVFEIPDNAREHLPLSCSGLER